MDSSTRQIVHETTCGTAALTAGLSAAIADANAARRERAYEIAAITQHNRTAIAQAAQRIQARRDAKRQHLLGLLAAIRTSK